MSGETGEGTPIVNPSTGNSAYITIDDIKDRISSSKLIQLTDFDNAGTMDEDKISAVIAAASSLIDSYCAARYSLPLTVSDQIKECTLGIVIYKLHQLRQAASDQIRQDYEDSIAFLKDVAAGRATLDQPSVTQAVPTTGVVTRNHDTDPEVFDNTRLADF